MRPAHGLASDDIVTHAGSLAEAHARCPGCSVEHADTGCHDGAPDGGRVSAPFVRCSSSADETRIECQHVVRRHDRGGGRAVGRVVGSASPSPSHRCRPLRRWVLRQSAVHRSRSPPRGSGTSPARHAWRFRRRLSAGNIERLRRRQAQPLPRDDRDRRVLAGRWIVVAGSPNDEKSDAGPNRVAIRARTAVVSRSPGRHTRS